MTTLVEDRTHVAREVADRFAALQSVEGVCLFGSLARGEQDEWSDIDLLVVGRDDELRPTLLLEALPDRLRHERVSLVCYSANELRQLFEAGSSFVDHIRHEGRILSDRDGFLEGLLHAPFDPQPDTRKELDAEVARLDVYKDLTLFNDNFLFPLAQIYAIGKAVVILGLLAEGRREFSRERAFVEFRRRHHELHLEVDTVAALRPFYRRVTRRQPERLPFPYKGARPEVERAISAVRAIAAAVR